MGAKYDFLSIPSPKNNGETRTLFPRLVFNDTIPWERIVKEVAHDSGFTPGAIKGMMNEVEERVLRYLGYGHRVQVGDMCYAEPTIEQIDADREITDESEVHAQSFRFGKVNLQATKTFRPRGELVRADRYNKFSHSSSHLTPQERYALLCDYLAEHNTITRPQYSELTGLLRSSAQRELNRWLAEGRLDFSGRATHKVYLLPNQ